MRVCQYRATNFGIMWPGPEFETQTRGNRKLSCVGYD